MSQLKIGLICPAEERDRITHDGQKPRESRILRTNRISLLAVAAATPPGHEIEYVDEHIEPIDFDNDYDVVGISLMTGLAPRAYEIGDRFRQRGVPVVFGGYHPTFLPDEALNHCDAVCIGEAELVWPTILEDAARGELQKIYKADSPVNLNELNFLRRDLLKQHSYFTTNLVLSGRGCPYTCDFCSVTEFFGNTYRFRPVEEVIREVASLDGKLVLFGDDNIVADTSFAASLFRAMIPLQKSWMSQANLSIAENAELLTLAEQSGCTGVFIGLESLSNQSLRGVAKGFYDAQRYRDLIAKLNDHGIAVMGGFIFGFDHDDRGVFERTVEFVQRSGFIAAQIAILTPFPGTRLYHRLMTQRRIFNHDWSLYDYRHVVFRPNKLTPDELSEGVAWTIRELYSYPSIAKRLARLTGTWGPVDTFRYALPLNLGYRWDLRSGGDGSGDHRTPKSASIQSSEVSL